MRSKRSLEFEWSSGSSLRNTFVVWGSVPWWILFSFYTVLFGGALVNIHDIIMTFFLAYYFSFSCLESEYFHDFKLYLHVFVAWKQWGGGATKLDLEKKSFLWIISFFMNPFFLINSFTWCSTDSIKLYIKVYILISSS